MNRSHFLKTRNLDIPAHSNVPLTPCTFLERTGQTFPQKLALIHRDHVITYGKLLHRGRCLAQVLERLEVSLGDRVAVLSENSIQTVEANFAIPGVGAIIVMLNPWLSPNDVIQLLDQCKPKVLIAEASLFQKFSDSWPNGLNHSQQIILFNQQTENYREEAIDYERALENETGEFCLSQSIHLEYEPVALNFTSGTTGNPKGVIYSHRAGYLQALGQALMLGLSKKSNYLWTLPMFHVNGWGHIWACVAVGCTQVIPISNVNQSRKNELVEMIGKFGITHLAGSPRVIRSLSEASSQKDALWNLTVMTGGTSPSTTLIQELENKGVHLIHQYGLNETCGPFVVCEEQAEWQSLPSEDRAKLRVRQGVASIHAGVGLRVVDEKGNDVPHDGQTLGEAIMAGNTVALCYYKNKEATEKAFRNGWFYSGDMAVVHPDGYLEIRDRMKDLIYVETAYGWENISSIEIENVLCRNELVKDAAVIVVTFEAIDSAGSMLVAFVESKNGVQIDMKELHLYCDKNLSIYKRPQMIFFDELPKTSTGKVRKDLLIIDAQNRINNNLSRPSINATLVG